MADKPNVVFMLADNIGWGDLSCYGNLNPTPRLDQLASEGIRFTNFNTEAQCTPTRSALMTGRMPIRSGTFTVPLGGSAPYGLCPWEYTMGDLFSDTGYATGMFGKWHLGKVADGSRPPRALTSGGASASPPMRLAGLRIRCIPTISPVPRSSKPSRASPTRRSTTST